jgi:hypothetical protein
MNAGSIGLLLLPVFTLLPPRAALLAAQALPESRSASLCRDEEKIIFYCAVAPGARIVSLCASNALDHRRGYLQYRYGKPGAIELQFPQARANTQIAFRYAHYFRAQVDRTEVSFDNQGYRYTLFDYFEGDVKPAIITAGVRVSKHDTKGAETEFRCVAKPTSNLGKLENVITRDHDNPLNQ